MISDFRFPHDKIKIMKAPCQKTSLLFAVAMVLLSFLHVVDAKFRDDIMLGRLRHRPRHQHHLQRRGFHIVMFASSTKKKRHSPRQLMAHNDIALRGGGVRGDDGDLVEENPDYQPPMRTHLVESDDDGDSTGDNEDGEEEGDIEGGDCNQKGNKVNEHEKDNLVSVSKGSKQSKTKKRRSINKRLYKLWKHNQFNIYVLLAIIAFRKDIYHSCIHYHIIPTQINPITGEREIVVRWSTDVLKLILVLEVVRRCFFLPSLSLSSSSRKRSIEMLGDDDDGSDDANVEKRNQTHADDDDVQETSSEAFPAIPLLSLLLLLAMMLILPTLLLRRSITSGYTPLLLPILTSFIFRSMRGGIGGGIGDSNIMRWILPAFGDGDLVTRMAYLPPLEQHYAFEQLNERYFRDWAAWRKAHPTNHALLQSHLHYSGFFKNHTSSATLVGTVGSNNKSDRRAGGIMTLIDAIISRNKYTSLQSKELHRQQHQQAVKVSSLSSRYPHVYNNGTAIVLDMTKLDTQVSSMETIRDQISFLVHLVQSEHEEFFRSKIIGDPMKSNDTATDNITTTASQCDEDQAAHDISAPLLEIIVVLESPGGSVSSYGLVASHLQRLRSTPGIKLTICVDSVAASGGYMIACMASKGQLFAAPFAMIGSIGVIGQSINVQKALEKFGVRPYVFLGGKNKQPVGMLGDVTKDGLEIMQLMINRIHESFRKHVRDAREESLVKAFIEEGGDDQPPNNYFQLGSQTKPSHLQQSLDRVTNGDVFMGAQALKLGLVDRLTTSDEYIAERIQHGTRVLKLVNCHRHVGLSSLLMPTHHSVAWNRWFVRAKNLVSTIFASWLGFDASHSVSSNIQVKMDADLR